MPCHFLQPHEAIDRIPAPIASCFPNMISAPEPRRAVLRARLVVEATHFGQHFQPLARSLLTMITNIALSRTVMSPMAAFLALSIPGQFAQAAPTTGRAHV